MPEILYEKRGDAVAISSEYHGTIVVDHDSCLMALRNIQRNRVAYANEEAFNAHYQKYWKALSFFADATE